MTNQKNASRNNAESSNSTLWYIISIAALFSVGALVGILAFENAILGILVLAALLPIPIILLAMKNRREILDSGSESAPSREDI